VSARCTHWVGAERRHCGATEQVRPFLQGPACPAHTPNALKGLPEIPPGPGRPRDWTQPPAPRVPTARDRRHLTAVRAAEPAT
jgi:hypothetical protein